MEVFATRRNPCTASSRIGAALVVELILTFGLKCTHLPVFLKQVLSRSNIRYLPPYIPYLLNYLLIWVKTVTYCYEPYTLFKKCRKLWSPTSGN